ncbi:FtsX-like permease family protein [Streptomyces sp. NPDC004031]
MSGRRWGAVPGAGRLHAWRVAVRIARRDALRYKARSLLVLAMIAVPIMGVSAADVTVRSSQLSVGEKATRELGAADARLSDPGYGPQPVYEDPKDGVGMPLKHQDPADGEGPAADPVVDPLTALPAGARWLSDVHAYAPVMGKYGLLDTEVRELKAGDPMAKGITRLLRGRYPRTPDEAGATGQFLKYSGLDIGSRVKVRGLSRSYTIVGVYELPSDLNDAQLNVLPGAFVAPYQAAADTMKDRFSPGRLSYLVSFPGDFTWEMVKHANTLGVVVDSRQVREHQPPAAEVPLYRARPESVRLLSDGSDTRAEAVAVIVTIVGLSIVEICLLAGPAFAVGARRSRRQLGLVGANGGDRRHIRAMVISSGLVIGVGAAVVGTVLGVALTQLLRGPLEEHGGARFGGLTLRPLELAAIGGLAVLTGVLAAMVPAVSAARQSVLASLTGRRGVRRASRVLPLMGAGVMVIGVATTVYATTRTDSIYSAVLGTSLAEIGLAMTTPVLIGLFGRLGRWLPTAPRLALRDTVRNRGRTAPAVAAVLAAVAGSVAVATYTASKGQEDRQAHHAMLPYGSVAVSGLGSASGDLARVRAAVEKDFPVTGRVDVSRIYIGAPSCAVDEEEGCGAVQAEMPDANRCPSAPHEGGPAVRPTSVEVLLADWRCTRPNRATAMPSDGGIMVGGADVLHALGIRDPAAEQALGRGETVLFDRAYADHGTLRVTVIADVTKTDVGEGSEPAGKVKVLPAYLAAEDTPYGLMALVPPRAAEAAGFRTVALGSFYTTARMPSGKEQQTLDLDVAKIGTQASVYVEDGYSRHDGVLLLALAIFAGLVTVGAAGITTGLAQADAGPDLRTLAAIGASGGIRRTLSGFQCGIVAVMGVVLGSVAGVLPAVALRRVERRHRWAQFRRDLLHGWTDASSVPHVPVAIPWGTLTLLVVAVPLGAGLLAALVTRSRPQLGRRADG